MLGIPAPVRPHDVDDTCQASRLHSAYPHFQLFLLMQPTLGVTVAVAAAFIVAAAANATAHGLACVAATAC